MVSVNRLSAISRSMARRIRSPQHTFNLRAPPFAIQPFFIAPVLPGETMKSLRFQARSVTDPIKNRLIGWWSEWYFFYVKLRDLDIRGNIQQMLLDPNFDWTTIDEPTADVKLYHPPGVGMVNYVKLCQDVCVRHFFRDERDTETQYIMVDNTIPWPVAQINGNNTFDSMEAFVEDTPNANAGIVVGGDDTVLASEIDAVMRRWFLLRNNQLTEMSYEQYLATFGVRMQGEEAHVPELLRYIREWSYPTNTVEPTTGVPTSAVAWTVQATADKDRMFREPGFLFGLACHRPKVYLRNQKGNFSAALNRVQDWLPAMMRADPLSRRKQLAQGVGPFSVGSDATGYVYDVADLFMYGDQMVNADLTATTLNLVPLPQPDLVNKRYVTDIAWVKELFAGTTPPARVEMDGIVSLSIASSLRDESPRGGTILQA